MFLCLSLAMLRLYLTSPADQQRVGGVLVDDAGLDFQVLRAAREDVVGLVTHLLVERQHGAVDRLRLRLSIAGDDQLPLEGLATNGGADWHRLLERRDVEGNPHGL